jgi:hypothetical protein
VRSAWINESNAIEINKQTNSASQYCTNLKSD